MAGPSTSQTNEPFESEELDSKYIPFSPKEQLFAASLHREFETIPVLRLE
jgi:hypothetical protein